MVVAPDAEAGNKVTVDVVQLCIPAAHGLPGQELVGIAGLLFELNA